MVTSLVVQWLRLWASSAGGVGSIPCQGKWSHMPWGKVKKEERNGNMMCLVKMWIFLWWFYVRFVCLSFLVLYFPCLLLRHSPVLHTCVKVIVRTLRMAMLAFNVGFSRYRWFEVVELSFLIILNMCAACVFIFMSLFTCFFPSYMYQFWFWQLPSF